MSFAFFGLVVAFIIALLFAWFMVTEVLPWALALFVLYVVCSVIFDCCRQRND
jgi:multisubunit Na+/H+ antiporter MnhE subunit